VVHEPIAIAVRRFNENGLIEKHTIAPGDVNSVHHNLTTLFFWKDQIWKYDVGTNGILLRYWGNEDFEIARQTDVDSLMSEAGADVTTITRQGVDDILNLITMKSGWKLSYSDRTKKAGAYADTRQLGIRIEAEHGAWGINRIIVKSTSNANPWTHTIGESVSFQ
jgi:hypothetical protein